MTSVCFSCDTQQYQNFIQSASFLQRPSTWAIPCYCFPVFIALIVSQVQRMQAMPCFDARKRGTRGTEDPQDSNNKLGRARHRFLCVRPPPQQPPSSEGGSRGTMRKCLMSGFVCRGNEMKGIYYYYYWAAWFARVNSGHWYLQRVPYLIAQWWAGQVDEFPTWKQNK